LGLVTASLQQSKADSFASLVVWYEMLTAEDGCAMMRVGVDEFDSVNKS
jgi:hypothetical protein